MTTFSIPSRKRRVRKPVSASLELAALRSPAASASRVPGHERAPSIRRNPIFEEWGGAPQLQGACVRLFADETIDNAVRRFRKATQRSGILTDARRKEHFISKPEVRKIKRRAAQTRRSKGYAL